MQRFYVKKLNDAQVTEHNLVKVKNRLAPMENMDNNVDIIFGFSKIHSCRSKVLHVGKRQADSSDKMNTNDE